MKKFAATLILGLSFAANAGYYYASASHSWEELKNNYDIDFEYDQIFFGGTAVSILDTCMDDSETIRTKYKITIEEMDGDDFVVIGEDYLYKSIYGTKAMVDGEGTIDVPVTHATTRTINVVEADGEWPKTLFSKDYTIPACE